jgi:hypothetical protein
MSLAVTSISFGEWLPDQADLGGGGLIVAQNVLPVDDGYVPFRPLDTSLATFPAANAVDSAAFGFADPVGYIYAHSAFAHTLASSANGATFTVRGTISGNVCFTQFDNLMIMASDQSAPFVHTIGASTNISTLSAATVPFAGCIGVVNRFVVLGDVNDTITDRPSTIRWCSIDDPTKWPNPNSATAIATQAGEQNLNAAYGDVKAIHGGDQYAIILQRNAVIRMTYVGPPVVFQFDAIDIMHGLALQRGSIKVGNIVYFISDIGFFRTDGVSVQRIGQGKVDRYFLSTIQHPNRTVPNCGYDPSTGLVYFGYSTDASSFDIDRIIIYNPATDSFSFANQDLEVFVTPIPGLSSPSKLLGFGVGGNSVLGSFQATAGAATLETSEFEISPGGRGFLSGIKPNVESSGTAPAVSVRVGYRDDLSAASTYTATTTPYTRTGMANFRIDSKYAKAEVRVVGNFDKTRGIAAEAAESSSA